MIDVPGHVNGSGLSALGLVRGGRRRRRRRRRIRRRRRRRRVPSRALYLVKAVALQPNAFGNVQQA